jgi:lipoprotein NlpD
LSHLTVLFLILLSLEFAGCASTHSPAPVRETSHTNKPLPPASAGYYRILSGDTLFKIAFEFGLDFRDLAAWNNLSDPTHIRSGDLLRLSPPKSVVTTAAIQNKPTILSRAIKSPSALPVDEASNEAAPESWMWPSKGALLMRFGDGISKGVDIGGMRGNLVQAAASGKVVYAGSGLRGYGKLIIIRHGKTLLSAYAHNARILVNEGQIVTRGQPVAEMGDTDSDRVKLHFEIREYGKPVDPLNYLPKQS